MGCCCFRAKKQESGAQQAALVRFSNVKGPACKSSNFSLSGVGTCFANAPLLQTRAYFDVKITEKGEFCIGVAVKNQKELEKHLNQRKQSWCLYSGEGGGKYAVGDVIGCSYDMGQVRPLLEFYHNGVKLPGVSIDEVKGDVHPAISVSGGAMLLANFGQAPFEYPPPDKFDPVMFSRDMLSQEPPA